MRTWSFAQWSNEPRDFQREELGVLTWWSSDGNKELIKDYGNVMLI